MKQIRLRAFIGALTIFLILCHVVSTEAFPIQHGFLLKQYDEFHDVLHPLEHDALPQKDYRRIRAQASELVRLGNAIVKVGVPGGPSNARKEFAQELRKFKKALEKFKANARWGTDEQLRVSYSAVHDSFEELARILPRPYPHGLPPMVTLNCPSEIPTAGTPINLTASTSDPEESTYTWTLSAGKIQNGQNTQKITLDTTGLAGQPIEITVEVSVGGHRVNALCRLQIAPGSPK